MNLRKLLSKNNGFYYLGILVIIIALSFWGIQFESLQFKYFCYLAYFIYSLYFIYYLYIRDSVENDEVLLVTLSFIYIILFFIDSILAIPFIPLYFIVAFKSINIKHKKVVIMTVYTVIISIGIFAFILSLLFNGFSSEMVEGIYYSPNRQKNVTVISVDLGATGGGTKAYIEKSYLGLLKLKRKIFIGKFEEIPNIDWINNNSVNINGETIEVR